MDKLNETQRKHKGIIEEKGFVLYMRLKKKYAMSDIIIIADKLKVEAQKDMSYVYSGNL